MRGVVNSLNGKKGDIIFKGPETAIKKKDGWKKGSKSDIHCHWGNGEKRKIRRACPRWCTENGGKHGKSLLKYHNSLRGKSSKKLT